MYKRALTVLLTAHLLFLAGFLCLGQMEEIQRNLQIKVPVAADSESRMIGIASRTSSGQRVVDCNELQRNSRYHLDMAELEVLLKIVEAEAGCEDEEGKLLVANVILNRLNSDKFPDSVSEIVFQQENGITQFSPVSDGSYDRVQISEETVRAVGRALDGEEHFILPPEIMRTVNECVGLMKSLHCYSGTADMSFLRNNKNKNVACSLDFINSPCNSA